MRTLGAERTHANALTELCICQDGDDFYYSR
jgi:hypothetical protein